MIHFLGICYKLKLQTVKDSCQKHKASYLCFDLLAFHSILPVSLLLTAVLIILFSLLDSDDLCTPPDGPLSAAHWEIAASVVAEIRSQITMVTGLTASAGIAPNMMLAKVASDMNKPDGQFLVEPTREGMLGFVRQLPIRKVLLVHVCVSISL